MKKIILAGVVSLMGTTAMADGIGVSMALFDDNFLTVLRNGIQKQADDNGLSVQIEDAQNDVAKQLDQINNFIASGVTAIIVTHDPGVAASTDRVVRIHDGRITYDGPPTAEALAGAGRQVAADETPA